MVADTVPAHEQPSALGRSTKDIAQDVAANSPGLRRSRLAHNGAYFATTSTVLPGGPPVDWHTHSRRRQFGKRQAGSAVSTNRMPGALARRSRRPCGICCEFTRHQPALHAPSRSTCVPFGNVAIFIPVMPFVGSGTSLCAMLKTSASPPVTIAVLACAGVAGLAGSAARRLRLAQHDRDVARLDYLVSDHTDTEVLQGAILDVPRGPADHSVCRISGGITPKRLPEAWPL